MVEKDTLITITRQYGSGGREISHMVADKMGVHRYDRQIVATAARKIHDANVTEDDLKTIIESSYNVPENCLGNLGDYAFVRVPEHNKMYVEQAKVILGIAKEEKSAVFVGRCADYILRDFKHHYRFFIYADDEFRKRRSIERYGSRSLKELDAVDKQRKRYYAYYTGQTWGAPQNYDLMINTSHMPLEAAADLILQYVELSQKFEKETAE